MGAYEFETIEPILAPQLSTPGDGEEISSAETLIQFIWEDDNNFDEIEYKFYIYKKMDRVYRLKISYYFN